MTTTRGAAFTTTHWVIDRIHRNTTNTWATTEPAVTASFTKNAIFVLVIANRTDGCTAASVQEADFPGRKLHSRTLTINQKQAEQIDQQNGRFVRRDLGVARLRES